MGRLGGTDGGVGEKKGGWKGVDGFGRVRDEGGFGRHVLSCNSF